MATMPRTPLRIGFVGTRRGAVYGCLFDAHDHCQIAAGCDIDATYLEPFQRQFNLPDSRCFSNYDDFLNVGLDVVVVGTPIPCHAEQAIGALEADAHVLSEVTAASNLEECRAILEAVTQTGKKYMLAENCVYWPFIQEWQRIVATGRLGDIFYAECEYLHPTRDLIVDSQTKEKKWRAQRPPIHYCTHSLGPILEITHDRIVRAMGLGLGHRILPEGEVGGIDIQVALFQTQKDVIIKLLRTSVAPRVVMHHYMLQGTKGFIETDRQGAGGKGRLYVEGEAEKSEQINCAVVDESLPADLREVGHGSAEYGVVREFMDALLSDRQPVLDVHRAMDLTVPGLVAHESALQGGKWLDVPTL